MYKKLLKLSSINILTGMINFLSTILAVKIFGLQIFGEFAIFTSYIAIISIMYLIIPPNISVMKLQDDETFYSVLLNSYILTNIIVSIFISVIFIINGNFLGLKIDYYLVVLYGIMYSIFNFMDIKSQANNKLNIYFLYLFFQALLRILLLIYVYYFYKIFDLNLLIFSFVLPQLIIVIFNYIKFRNMENTFKLDFKLVYEFIINEIKTLKNFYFEIFLKKIKDNIVILVFSNFVSKEVIGMYSLLTKIGTFVLSQARILEAFFMNKENINSSNIIESKIYIISGILQILIIVVGLVYLKLSINEYNIYLLVIYSFITYPYLNVIITRNKLYLTYKNDSIIKSLILYILLIICFSSYSYFINITNIYIIVITILLSEFITSFYLIYSRRNKI